MAHTRRVVILAFPDVQALDVTGPAEVFSLAERAHPGVNPSDYRSRFSGPAAPENVFVIRSQAR